MGMNVGPKSGEDDVMLDVNMTPLIDVMLVLLIMFIITIPIPNNAININLPNGAPPPLTDQKPPETINLRAEARGRLFCHDQAVADRQALKVLFESVAQKADQDQIKFKPDPQAEYKNIAMVMALAQQSKVTKIGIVSNN